MAASAPFPLHVDSTTGEIISSIPPDRPTPPEQPTRPFSTLPYSAASSAPLLRVAIGGEYAALTRPTGRDPVPHEWVRGTVKRFSPRSRSRMLQALAKTDTRYLTGRAWFVTLTWPREWTRLPYKWKEMLETFRKRLHRRHPESWFFWKLEFQQRGAPHYHLLLFGPERLDSRQLHQDWYEIVGSHQLAHWRYGVDVKLLREWRQVTGYCSKYAAKVDQSTDTDGVGRYWGIGSRANRVETVIEGQVSDAEFWQIRRVFKRLIRAANGYYSAGGPASGVWVRISNHNAKRVLDWATSTRLHERDGPTEIATSGAFASDMRVSSTSTSNISGSAVAAETRTARSNHSARLPLFDAADLQRRAARRLFG